MARRALAAGGRRISQPGRSPPHLPCVRGPVPPRPLQKRRSLCETQRPAASQRQEDTGADRLRRCGVVLFQNERWWWLVFVMWSSWVWVQL